MIVTGGCAIQLQFQRSGLSIPPTFVFVPINEIVITDDIIIWTGEEEQQEECTEDTRQPPEFSILPSIPRTGIKLVEPGILLNQQVWFHIYIAWTQKTLLFLGLC